VSAAQAASEAAALAAFTTDADFFARAAAAVSLQHAAQRPDPAHPPPHGDHLLNARTPDAAQLAAARPAAVLIGIVERPEGARVILTRRASHLREHSGQVAFPGGKIDARDTSPLEAALREAHEEIGLDPALTAPIGYLDAYLTGTGFRVIPVLARVSPLFEPAPDAREVEAVFEPPLAFLMRQENHQREAREWKGVLYHFHAMPWEGHKIWGATAGILHALHARLYGGG
jgi:8-oxo-dGTP pyrophosphatase MutT (NUDIX family)